jgi:hypothetical protein
VQKSFFGIAVVVLLAYCTSASATIVTSDSFTYPDGPLVGQGTWTTHSGTANQVDVASGMVNLTQAESEDVNKLLGSTFTTGTLYAGLSFNFSALPLGAGNYFFHFKDGTTSGFRGRVFATTTGAASGAFRLGISDTTGTPSAIIPTDIALNTNHRLVLSLDAATGRSSLFLDALTETGGVTAIDTTSALGVSTIALRQSTASGAGMGVLRVDDLVVATTFAQAAVPEASSFLFGGLALCAAGAPALKRRWKARKAG